jgi:hypothetical protein
MVIVAGHITVDPEQRESYLAGSMSVVERARRADGCLDSAITADLLDPSRVNLFERSLSDPRWANTTVLSSDVAAAAGGLRAKPGRDCRCTAAAPLAVISRQESAALVMPSLRGFERMPLVRPPRLNPAECL